MKKLLITLLKFGISAAIIAYLVWDVQRNESFRDLLGQPKHWGLLTAAWALCMSMVSLTIVRWYLLVRALELPFTMKDAFRLGFLGYLLNFFSLGAVGGDLFKAVFVAREQPGRRAEAVATVVIDRIIGLYALFVIATIAIFCTNLLESPVPEIRVVCQATLIGTVVGAIGIAGVLTPGFTQGALSEFLASLPRVGHTIGRLIGALRMYRRRLGVLVFSLLVSMGVHACGAIGIYLIGRGLGGQCPSLLDHFVMVPLGMIVGVVPLPMSGLGAFEAVMEFLYLNVPTGMAIARGQGLVVAFGYRLITVAIAIVGLFYYLNSRREVAATIRASEQFEADQADAPVMQQSPGLLEPERTEASVSGS